MYQGKLYKRFCGSKKSVALLLSLLLLLTAAIGGTVALLTDSAGPLRNLFVPTRVTTQVVETLDGNTKKNVSIKNTGNTDAWIRAAVVVTWKNSAGDVYGQAPAAGTNYRIEWGTGWADRWEIGADGFYYRISPVAPNETTGDLIVSVSPIGNAPLEGYYLNVEIIGSGIQSKPVTAFDDAWGTASRLRVNGSAVNPSDWTLDVRTTGE